MSNGGARQADGACAQAIKIQRHRRRRQDRVAPLKGSTSQLLFSRVALSGMPGQPNLGMLLERAVRNAVEGEW